MSRSDIVDKGKQTPFQKAGFTVDTVFEVIVNGNFNLGDHLKLKKDDGSESPDFIRLSDGKVSYTYLERIKEYVDPFPHTVYVKFDNYHKEYSYLCDDETASSYKLWRAEALHGEYRVNVETKDGVKTPYVTRLALNRKPPAATKCIIPFTKVRSVLDDYKAEVPVIEVGDVVKRKAEEAVGVLPNTYEVVDINKEGWIKLKGKEQHSYWNTKHFNIVSKKCENTALQDSNTPVKSPLDDVVSIEITDGTNQIHKMSGYILDKGFVDTEDLRNIHKWNGPKPCSEYSKYSKEDVDKLVEDGRLGAIGLDMWKRTGTINPDFIHPSPSQAKTLGAAVVEYCKKQYFPGSTWDSSGGSFLDGITKGNVLKCRGEGVEVSIPKFNWDLGGHCLDGTHPTREQIEAFSKAGARLGIKDFYYVRSTNNLIKPKEEVSMSNRKVVSVKLIDQDKGLDVADSLVFDFGNIVTEDDQATTIQQLIMDFEVGEIVRQHNEVRVNVTDLDILRRTGQEVKLREIKLKDLSWSYTVV